MSEFQPPEDAKSDNQVQQISQQFFTFLERLPDYLGSFFNQYKQPLIAIALLLAAFITIRVVFSTLNALNNIPLVKVIFELIGLGYSAWFIYRNLLTASDRQELYSQIQTIKEQVVGERISSTTAGQANKFIGNLTSPAKQPAATPTVESATESVRKIMSPDVQPPVVAKEAEPSSDAVTSPAESSESQDAPELVRPNPPDPELVEAAIHDAEEKALDASPPEVDPEG